MQPEKLRHWIFSQFFVFQSLPGQFVIADTAQYQRHKDHVWLCPEGERGACVTVIRENCEKKKIHSLAIFTLASLRSLSLESTISHEQQIVKRVISNWINYQIKGGCGRGGDGNILWCLISSTGDCGFYFFCFVVD